MRAQRVEALCLLSALVLAIMPAASAAAQPFRGMTLEEAISVLERQGVTIIYSSAFVKPWMRIRAEPSATEPHEALEEILAPFGLHARAGPNSIFAIVRREPSGRSISHSDRELAMPSADHPRSDESLEQIVVAASQYELTRTWNASLMSLSGTDIENLPDIGDDALRAVARLPGTTSNGISARTNVRGGDADENLVRFDGVRLYNPFHLRNFQSIFSAIDPRIVSSVDVLTGGFAPRFGDRMSSVFDITSLATPAPLYHELNVSVFNASALGAGRFAADKGEWLVSGRRSNLDVWYHSLSKEPGNPSYEDAFAKVSYRLSERSRLTASALFFKDEIGLAAEDQQQRASAEYSDRYLWLRLEQQPNDSLSGVSLLAHTKLRSARNGSTEQDGVSTGSLSEDRAFDIESLQSDWSWHVKDRCIVEFGGEVKLARGRYDYHDEVEYALLFDTPGANSQIARERTLRVEPNRSQYAAYATVRYGFTPRLISDVGLRWESHALSPRLGARYELGERTALRSSWARMYQSQGIDELQVSDGVTTFFAPQRTDHLSLALDHRLPLGVELRIELYEKRQRHLQPRFENLLNPLTLVPELNPDRIRVAPEHGRSRGVELLLSNAHAAPLAWWLSYTRSLAEERQSGMDVLRSWDQTHAFSAGLNWSTERWNVGVGLIQRSGWPVTAVNLQHVSAVPVAVAGSRNVNRTALFRSLDVRVARSFALDHSSLSVFFEVANALGRANPCCSSYEIDDETGELELEERYFIPRIPSLGVLWQF